MSCNNCIAHNSWIEIGLSTERVACESRKKYVEEFAIAVSVKDLEYSSLKEKEKLVIANFLSGKDTFVDLPTG